MDIFYNTVIRWFINMSRGTCEKTLMLIFLVQAANRVTEGHQSERENIKQLSGKNKKEIPSAWHLNPLYEADKRIGQGDQTCSKEFLIESRQRTEPGSVSSQTHPPMWPANHCTRDTKLAWRKSQNTKPSAALLNLNEWEKKKMYSHASTHTGFLL